MGALERICSSALESYDAVRWGYAGAIGGSRPDKRRDAEQCLVLLASLDLKGEQSAIGVCFRDKQRFERDRPLWYVCIGKMAKRCR